MVTNMGLCLVECESFCELTVLVRLYVNFLVYVAIFSGYSRLRENKEVYDINYICGIALSPVVQKRVKS